ncbi:hypothetical protein ACKVMT_06045 [Halobacteriales archaeon Cl-PHB]
MARRLRSLSGLATTGGLFAAATGTGAAHAGSFGSATSSPPVPSWFVIMTAGVVVGSSFLFTSLMADHASLQWVNGLGLGARLPSTLWGWLRGLLQVGSVLALAGIVVVGFLGTSNPRANLATVLVWVGWWSGYTMTTYLVGNTWPALNPWRALSRLVPGEARLDYPEWLGAWPAVFGLLLLVWLEVVSAVASNPAQLSTIVVGYTVVTLLGTALVGRERWFDSVDPIANVFRMYGKIAPIQRTDDGLRLRLPGAALTDARVFSTPGRVAFVVALLWATTYDGMVSTPLVEGVLGPFVDLGIPAVLLYLVILGLGFAAFYAIYVYASRKSRETADTYVTPPAIARWLAPSLLPIAAGYHLAHFLGYVVSLAPTIPKTVLETVQHLGTGPGAVTVVVLPGWFGLIQLSFVLLGHLLAIWVAHSIAFELFPGARQPIRSQYPTIVVMIVYTMVSAWVVIAPTTAVPYV